MFASVSLYFSFYRTGFYAAKDLLQADETEDIANFSSHLKSISPTSSFVYVDLPSSKTKKKGTTGILDYLTKRSQNELEKQLGPLASQTTRPLAPAVGKLRMIKSEVEQAVMKAAGGISGRAHAKVREANLGQVVLITYGSIDDAICSTWDV